jgi:hypothetical protein
MNLTASCILVGAAATLQLGCGEVPSSEGDSYATAPDDAIGEVSLPLTTTFVSGTVPWFYEFNATENPSGYYWCGHAALKVVGQYITGTTKTLGAIQSTFKANSSKGFALDTYCKDAGVPTKHWCAKAQDLWWAAQLSQNSGYGRSSSYVKQVGRASDTFFAQIKASTNSNFPSIIPSNYLYGGHFWIVVGYLDSGTASSSTLYLRDTANKSGPVYTKYDSAVTVSDFLASTQTDSKTIAIVYVK